MLSSIKTPYLRFVCGASVCILWGNMRTKAFCGNCGKIAPDKLWKTRAGGAAEGREPLMENGSRPGARVTLKKKAPLGDPVEIELRGYSLSLRKSEAAAVEAEI